LRGGKGVTFMVGPGQHLASQCHCRRDNSNRNALRNKCRVSTS